MSGRKDKPWRCKTPLNLSKVSADENSETKDEVVTQEDTKASEIKEPHSKIIKSKEESSTQKVGEDSKWKTGEKILCFHGPLIYEAKIQNTELQNKVWKYFIHYHGWNKNWDEWVPEARMLKYSEKNCAIQKDLIRSHEEKTNDKRRRNKRKADEADADIENSSDPPAAGSSSASGSRSSDHVFAVPLTPSPIPGKRKAGLRPQKREIKKFIVEETVEEEECPPKRPPVELPKPPDNTVQSEEVFKSKVEIKIKIPDELKSYIVDDWEQVTRHRNLCLLPAKLTVHQLLDNYASAKTSKQDRKNNKEKAIQEVTAGVREYFNVMLPSQLLYKQERPQYEKLKQDDPSLVPIKVYGAPHLLRLFTKLGESLVYTPLGERSTSLLVVYLHDILNYIKRNASIIFTNSDYVNSDANVASQG